MPTIAVNRASQIFAFFRDAVWLTRPRVFSYATIFIIISAAIIGWALTGPGVNDPAGRPVGTDFVSFWTVSYALIKGNEHDIYSSDALAALQHILLPLEGTIFFPWLYPPTGFLLVYPLAFLPYLWSLTCWLAVGLACYMTVLWRILPQPLTLLTGLAFPGVLLTIGHGQNALLTTALLSGALILLPRWPITAGVLVGLLTFKPQLGLLLPVALLAGGHCRTVVAAMLISTVLVVTSAVLFGDGIWGDFLANVRLSRDILDEGFFPYYKMQSVFAAVRLMGGSLMLAYGLQTLAAVGSAAVVAWVWRHPTDPDLKNATVAIATPLATPYLLDYDLMIVAPAIAWLARRGSHQGLPPWQGTALVALFFTPLVSRIIGACTNLPLAPIAIGAVLASIIVQVKASWNAQSP